MSVLPDPSLTISAPYSRAILRAVALTKLEDADDASSVQNVKSVSIDNCNIGSTPRSDGT
jgi:hypothetical protein